MIMEKATNIKEIINVFSPMPLKEEEDLKKFRIDTIQYRTGNPKESPISDIFDTCTSPNMQSSCILMGHRGCGKSTELNHLLQIFKENGYTALSIDCTAESNILTIDYYDLMLLITESLLKIAEQKNISLNGNLIESVLNFFKETINETTKEEMDTTSSGIGLGFKIPILSDILNIFANIKNEYRYNTGKRETIKEIINQKSSVWLENITEISNHIINVLHFKKPVLIFEGLDKIEDEDRAFRIFSNNTLSKLNFPVIYTFPISLRYSSKFQDIVNIFGANIFTLPMIKITNKEDNTPYMDGINILKEIIYRRADESLFEAGAIDLLISKTGGTIRDVFNCIVLAARYARRGVNQLIILKEDIELALTELKSQLRTGLITSDYAKLWEIHLNKEDNKDENLMLNYLRRHFVLEYNGDGWCDVHPLILDFIKERLKARPELMNTNNE